jgi:hypothetical protein
MPKIKGIKGSGKIKNQGKSMGQSTKKIKKSRRNQGVKKSRGQSAGIKGSECLKKKSRGQRKKSRGQRRNQGVRVLVSSALTP